MSQKEDKKRKLDNSTIEPNDNNVSLSKKLTESIEKIAELEKQINQFKKDHKNTEKSIISPLT
jgi:predicted  nucleic acid-binding Zn-ribbon protein